MVIWLYGYTDIYGYMIIWLYRYMVVLLLGYMADYMVIWLYR